MDMYANSMMEDDSTSQDSNSPPSPIMHKTGAHANEAVANEGINTTPKAPKRLPLAASGGFIPPPETPIVEKRPNPYLKVNDKGTIIVDDMMDLSLDDVTPVFGPSKMINMENGTRLKYATCNIVKHAPDGRAHAATYAAIKDVKISPAPRYGKQKNSNSIMLAIPVEVFNKISKSVDNMQGGQDSDALFTASPVGIVNNGYVTINAAYSVSKPGEGSSKPPCKVFRAVYKKNDTEIAYDDLRNCKPDDVISVAFKIAEKVGDINDYVGRILTELGGKSALCDVLVSLGTSQTMEGKVSVKATIFSIKIKMVDKAFAVAAPRTPAVISSNLETTMTVGDIFSKLTNFSM